MAEKTITGKNKADVTVGGMFPKDHITGADLNGKDWPVKIRDFDEKMVFNPKDQQTRPVWTLWFEKVKKPLILNITMGQEISKMFGTDKPINWRGRMVVLYPTTVSAFGEEHLVVRVKEYKGKPPADVPAPDIATGEIEMDQSEQEFWNTAMGVLGMTETQAVTIIAGVDGDIGKAMAELRRLQEAD